MDSTFIAIVQKLVSDQGKNALINVAKCKAFLADYTRSEYKKESSLLLQALEAGVAKEIDSTQELEICRQQQVRHLQDDYFLAKEIAVEIVDMLAFVLGASTKMPKPQTALDTAVVSAQPSSSPITSPHWGKTNSDLRTKAPALFDIDVSGTITNYSGSSKDIVIPANISGIPVTSIGVKAFKKKKLTSVTIPNNVVSINEYAFQVNKLITVIIPNSVTSIGELAFYLNDLTSITIGNNVTFTRGDNTFNYNHFPYKGAGTYVLKNHWLWGNCLQKM
jgi:hypothetical protein